MSIRLCKWCSNPIPFEKPVENKCCSRKCASKLGHSKRIKKPTNKFCLYCNKSIPKKKKYCNYKCLSAAIEKETERKILNGEKVCEGRIKKYLIKVRGNKCEKCSWKEINPITRKCPIQMDHIDGNYENYSLTNLKLLCPNCHSLTPTFGALNKGHGRKYRYAGKT